MKVLTHFSLFTGIGGIDLAAEWAGFEPVGQCEFADYPTKVLEKHWPNVPRWRDVRDVARESVRERIGGGKITLLSGGFPCQPFSVAGKQRGEEDDRYLWPEMLRVIEELRPTWVIGENVVGLVKMALDQVLSDLESKGYTAIPIIIPACAVDAPHRRERVFIVGYSEHNGLPTSEVARSLAEASYNIQEGTDKASQSEGTGRPRSGCNVADSDSEWELQPQGNVSELGGWISNGGEALADTNGEGLQGWEEAGDSCAKGENGNEQLTRRNKAGTNWEPEPNVGRVANGVPSRVDRLKCLGNAVVPQQVYPILQAIADIEKSNKHRKE